MLGSDDRSPEAGCEDVLGYRPLKGPVIHRCDPDAFEIDEAGRHRVVVTQGEVSVKASQKAFECFPGIDLGQQLGHR